MFTAKDNDRCDVGLQFVDSTSVPRESHNLLFAALLITAFGVFSGNAFGIDASVASASACIAIVCLMQLLIFYSLSSITKSIPAGLAATYILMFITTYSRQPWLTPVMYLAGFSALVYTLIHLRVEARKWWVVLLMASMATATILGCVDGYTSFDMIRRLNVGMVNKDTLCHASIAAMIKNYGITSTGLHGLVNTPYHVLSHVLFADISVLSGKGVIETYGVATWILFAPLLIFCVSACTTMIDRSGKSSVPLIWCLTCSLLVLAPFLFKKWGLWNSFFLSESYLVSLGLFTLALPSFFKKRLDLPELLLLIVMAALVADAKATVAILFVGIWILRILFFHTKAMKAEGIALLLSLIAVFLVCYDSAHANSGSTAVDPLHFLRQYSVMGHHVSAAIDAFRSGKAPSPRALLMALAAVLSFVATHYFLTWIVVAYAGYKTGTAALLRVPYSVYALGTFLAAAAITSIFSFAGGSAFYFSNVPFFVALPGVAGILAHFPEKRNMLGKLAAGIIIAAACAVNFYVAHTASASKTRKVDPSSRAFVDALMDLRHKAPPNAVIVASPGFVAKNPVPDCSAQPFVYPAVSERPWLNVITGCSGPGYRDYGYGQYGLNGGKQRVVVAPVIPPGTIFIDSPLTQP